MSGEPGWSRIVSYRGGRLSTVSFEGVGADQYSCPPTGGGVRGSVRGFSSGSRRRLLRRMASVNRLAATRLPAWVTLTYPDEFPEDRYTHKRHLRAFLVRLRREFGPHAAVWRLEWQRRGAPHYHLLLWDFAATDAAIKWMHEAWYAVVGSGDPHHLRFGVAAVQATSWRGLTAYLSKYMAKPSEDEDETNRETGRIWGIEDSSKLPVEPVSYLVSVREGMAYRRTLRRLRGAGKRSCRWYRSATSYVSDETVARYVSSQTKAPVLLERIAGLPGVLLGAGILPPPVDGSLTLT